MSELAIDTPRTPSAALRGPAGRDLAIYYSTAVRGGASFAKLAARIDALSAIGHVLTEHMASPRTVDRGDDAAIHAHDQALLAKAHVFVADCAQPSTGVGYMAARAAARGIPVLCLFETGQAASAMIAGAPDIATRHYADEAEWMRHVRDFLLAHVDRMPATRAPKIFLWGPPGSGKGTLGAKLAELTAAPHVSTGELLRELVRDHPDDPIAQDIAAHMAAGRLVPAATMRDLVVARLAQPDCRLFGVILDGYPPSRDDLANLVEHGIAPDIVFYFECSDATAIARQVGRNARATDTPDKARARLATFHAANATFEELATSWYPNSLVVRVDAEQAPDPVLAMVRQTLRDNFGHARHARSYFAVPPARATDSRSTRLHFHVDASDVHAIRAIARAIHVHHAAAQGQIKIYPIRALALGPQHARLPIYQQLPNFHPIEDAEHEAFITGRLGDGDRALVQVALDVTRERGGMCELEEYVGEWTLRANGAIVVDAEYALVTDDTHAYPDVDEFRCTDIPAWELHHGFDVPRAEGADHAPPIPLAELIAACTDAGLDNGGWFIFANDRHWAYRSNEFADGDQAALRERLVAQAKALRAILAARGLASDVGFSLERVHGIWIFA